MIGGIYLITPIVIYFLLIKVYAINIPYVDDHGLKGFITKFYLNEHLMDKINAIFAQHNEHRIGLTRILLLLTYFIKNEIDYVWLMWIGNFFLIGILWIYWSYLQSKNITFYYLIPIAFLLFNIESHENTFWGMASVQNFGVIFFCLLGFFKFEQKKYALLSIYLTIAIFTSGNGFFALCVVGLMLILQKEWKVFMWMMLLGTIVGIVYFGNYQKPPATPTATISDFGKILTSTCCFLGSYIDFSNSLAVDFRRIITLSFGICLLIFVGIVLIINSPINFKKRKVIFPANFPEFIVCTLLFILITGLVVVYSRIIGYGYLTVLTSRYKIYSILLIVTLYVWILTILQEKFKRIILIFLSLTSMSGFFISLYQNITQIDYHHKLLISNAFNWDKGDFLNKKLTPDRNFNYSLPITILDKVIIENDGKGSNQFKEFEKIVSTETDITIEGNQPDLFLSPNEGIYLTLKSVKRMYVFPTFSVKTGIRKLIQQQMIFGGNFGVKILKSEIDSGKYQIGVLKIKNDTIMNFKTKNSAFVLNKISNPIKTNW